MSTTLRDRLDGLRRTLGLEDDADFQAAVVLGAALVLLVVHWHWGRPVYYRGSPLETRLPDLLGLEASDYAGTLPFLYWGAASVVMRIFVPLGIIVWVLRRAPADFGYRLGGTARKLPPYALLYVLMVPVLVVASYLDSFQATYPFYDRAVEGGLQFWLYQLGYAAQFLALEAFFRGFLVFGLAPRFGAGMAVAIQTVPYVMIHFGKPIPEVFAAIVAGFVLGHLALRSRSFVPGVYLHVAVAITMDVLALSHATGSLGSALGAVF